MKKIIKSAIKFTSTLLGVIEWLLRRLLLGGWTFWNLQPSNGRKIRIIANGPSLLEELGVAPHIDVDYLMLNHSAKTDTFFSIKPTCYVIIDPLFFSKILRDDKNFVDSFLKVDWNITLFVPATCVKKINKILFSNHFISVLPIPASIPTNIKLLSIRNFFFKHYLAAPPLQNVVVGALYSAIMSGYRDIELYGVGHSWTTQLQVNDQNQVCLRDVHYYQKDAPLKPWLQCNGEPYRMHIILRDLAQMFDSYWDIRNFAESIKSIKIVNKTHNSFIDAFEREYD